MTVLEKVTEYVRNKMRGNKHLIKMTSGEIVADVVRSKYHNVKSSIIPSDYCYNRFNLGLFRKNNIKLFVWDKENDIYEFVGENADYSGLIYGDSAQMNNDEIGMCEHGKRHLFDEYLQYAYKDGKITSREYYE
ncbi:MAG: hypothetical protein Q4E42_04045 [Phascolarctobacterium sp.]|nr:hypothetical protein [Phascolarctobacterium sp.]